MKLVLVAFLSMISAQLVASNLDFTNPVQNMAACTINVSHEQIPFSKFYVFTDMMAAMETGSAPVTLLAKMKDSAIADTEMGLIIQSGFSMTVKETAVALSGTVKMTGGEVPMYGEVPFPEQPGEFVANITLDFGGMPVPVTCKINM